MSGGMAPERDLLSPEPLDYFLRLAADPFARAATGEVIDVPPAERTLLHVDGVGRRDKTAAAGDRDLAPAREVVSALAGDGAPLAFAIRATPGTTAFELGSWGTPQPPLEAALRAAYLGVSATRLEPPEPRAWPRAGIALGLPAATRLDPGDDTTTADRLVRALRGTTWSVLVLATPVDNELLRTLRNRLINDMRAAAAAEAASDAPSPLVAQFQAVVKKRVEALTLALAEGAWRVAVHLLGDERSFPALASVWKALYSGSDEAAEPISIHENPVVSRWAARWSLPEEPADAGPASYRHPWAAQTLLTSAELGRLVELPRHELPGFAVTSQAAFDVVARDAGSDAIALGAVVHDRGATESQYRVTTTSLTRHAFICGTTGSGKTNTIFHLLAQAAERGVPFLVLEPAKAEYRALASHPAIGDRLRVFTAGVEGVSPLRMNPFEPPPGASVATHLDLLRAAFNASFGMWSPLPQVLERCLHEIYADYGWNLRDETNARLAGEQPTAEAFPTLGDLVAKVEEVVPKLGYEERVTADIEAALVTRLQALRTGGKGALFDNRRSLPVDELFAHPTVIELEGLGDDDDKALLMGLLLTRLVEHRRVQGPHGDLRHLLVVEEAHRLLSPGGAKDPLLEGGDPRGKAIDVFTNLLAETRAYGQGVIIADQVPARLVPEVVKNTNLKVAHRLIAGDDRETIAESAAMDASQARALTILGPGEAAVLSGGDDAPLNVQVPFVKLDPPVTAAVAERMGRWRADPAIASLFEVEPFCAATCATRDVCAAARDLGTDPVVRGVLARTVLSTIEQAAALDRLWDDVVVAVRSRRRPDLDEAALLRSLLAHGAAWWARRRGAQARWSYLDTQVIGELLRAALLERLDAPDGTVTEAREVFRAAATALHVRTFPPYFACDLVCTQQPPLCLYRRALADLIETRRFDESWREAETRDLDAEDTGERAGRAAAWQVSQDAAYQVIEFPESDLPPEHVEAVAAAARRAALGFAQQMAARDESKAPRSMRRMVAGILEEAGV